MVDSITNEKEVSVLTSSRDNKDATINIPDDQNINEQLPATKVLPQVEGSKRGEGSLDGVINHTYEKPPDNWVLSFEEFQKRDEVRLRLEDESKDTKEDSGDERTPLKTPQRGPGEAKCSYMTKNVLVDGFTNDIYEDTPDEFCSACSYFRLNTVSY